MKYPKVVSLLLVLAFLFCACTAAPTQQTPTAPEHTDAVIIALRDNEITVDGNPASTDDTAAVYTANDIVYYESGKDFTYGEGSEADAHTKEEAAAHTVVHITKPGTYSLSGKLSLGQIAVDLGSDAKKDPNAVVTLILNGVDITCQVAPAVIFYNVYECGNDDAETATKDVDTSAAGANVIIADGTVNTVNGSYVARIYEPDSVVLNDDKTEVEDADKLHKYDGAFYSKRSMNISGGKENTGILNINAENEGLDSELHLTINGGNINIISGNDGINTNEDGVSVTTVNSGRLTIKVTGETGEGDGIDSNGWLVINGGTVIAAACSNSADAGIDSDMGIHITGGTVIASGHMLDRIEDGAQNYAVFNFSQKQTGSETVSMKAQDGTAIMEIKPENAYSILIYSSPDLKAGTYTLWSDDQQLAGGSGGMMGGGMRPDGMGRPDGMQPPEDFTRPDGNTPPEDFTRPDGDTPPEDFTRPSGDNPPQMPGGNRPGNPGGNNMTPQEQTPDFIIRDGGNMFSGIQALTT
ncbi:MAG: carbohydrate-binding domain-containing protein [Oscillospiraceae bacterium]|nr:carbohydrate-binding domain-containing protein [Oscillospiraceae bacterium]